MDFSYNQKKKKKIIVKRKRLLKKKILCFKCEVHITHVTEQELTAKSTKSILNDYHKYKQKTISYKPSNFLIPCLRDSCFLFNSCCFFFCCFLLIFFKSLFDIFISCTCMF